MAPNIGDPRMPERFWNKVSRSSEGCWEWTAHRDKDGYGGYRLSSAKGGKAHRAAYAGLVGEIPEGLVIDHLCRNRACVNPEHLEAVTNRVNIMRGEGGAAMNAQKTHCIRGHELSDDNISPWNLPKRNCLICMRRHKQEYLERKALATQAALE